MSKQPDRYSRFLPVLVVLGALFLWIVLSALKLFPLSTFPRPMDVLLVFQQELKSGRLLDDAVASSFRVSVGFSLAVVLGIPLGLTLGLSLHARAAFLPVVNFFRCLSPLAWIGFAIWALYYAGQAMICLGVTNALAKPAAT